MLNISAQECKLMIETIELEISSLDVELSRTSSRISQLKSERDAINKSLKSKQKRLNALARAILLITPIPTKTVEMRTALLNKMAKVTSKNITVATRDRLEKEIDTMRENLPRNCSHPFVFNVQGYEGSHYHDHEDAYPGLRYCVVCGFGEKTHETKPADALGLSKEYIYKTLKPSDNRIIETEPYTGDHRRFNIWVPLGAVLHPFEKSVENDLNK